MSQAIVASTGCPSCGGHAEPEEEDGLVKFVCSECEYEFGHTLHAQEDDCQIGVPEGVRRGLSLAGRSIDIPVPELTEEGRVFLGLPRRPE